MSPSVFSCRGLPNSNMDYKCVLLVCICFTLAVSEEHKKPSLKEKDLEKNIFQAYQVACHRLQDLTDWMAVALEVKGVWTRSLSRRKSEFLFGNIQRRIKRATVYDGDEISCASFRNLQRSTGTYVLGQVSLLQMMADLGGSLIKAGISSLGNSNDLLKALQERFRGAKLLNQTSGDLLKGVQDVSKKLIQQIQKDGEKAIAILKDSGVSDGMLRFFQARREEILEQLQLVIDENSTVPEVNKQQHSLKNATQFKNSLQKKLGTADS